MKCFKEAVVNRRSVYSLGKNIPVLESEIISAVERMTKEVPSSFNIQSARVIVAMNEHHDNVWNITEDALKNVVSITQFKETEKKLKGFKDAYGTILFFEDTATVEMTQGKFPQYAMNFPTWAAQANGMLQFAIWTQLEAMGLGVNLQHYNPLIDDRIKECFNVPEGWNLVAEMVFGEMLEPAAPIVKIPVKERVKVFA